MSETKKVPDPKPNPTVRQSRRLLWANIIFIVVLPMFVLPSSAVYLWRHGITRWELFSTLVLWIITGLGITAGYHRLFAHRSYSASWPARLGFAIAGAMAGQNSIIAWCSDHRRHHRFTDTDRDPYNANEGLLYSHVGWILVEGVAGDTYDDVPDLRADPIARFQHKFWLPLSAVGNLAILVPVGLWSERLGGVLLLAGLLRVILVQHFTFTINSLSHWWGKQPWSDKTTSRDNRLLALITFGEGYHNFHHTFQADYRNGLKWYDWDPTKWLIRGLASVGLAHKLRRTPEHLLLKTRFERRQTQLDVRLSTAGSEVQARMDLMLNDLAKSRKDAEARFEAALNNLRTQTQVWSEFRREATDRAHAEWQARSAVFKLEFREARLSARRCLAEWERAVSRELAVG